MPDEIAILIVHGVNTNPAFYSEQMIHAQLRDWPRALRDRVSIQVLTWPNMSYSPVMLGTLQEFPKRGIRGSIRGAVLDSSWYLDSRGKKAIHTAFLDALLRFPPQAPLMIVAHSLGCFISASFISEINILKQTADMGTGGDGVNTQEVASHAVASLPPICRMDTLAGFITLGCNMPLFASVRIRESTPHVSSSPDKDIAPAMPGTMLSSAISSKARWLNFYSKKDYLGLPLKEFIPDYDRESRLRDVRVRSEGILPSIFLPTPLAFQIAHSGYYNTLIVRREIRSMIEDIVFAEAMN